MRNDIIKYIAILIVIIGLVWWLLYKDNNSKESQYSNEAETESISSN